MPARLDVHYPKQCSARSQNKQQCKIYTNPNATGLISIPESLLAIHVEPAAKNAVFPVGAKYKLGKSLLLIFAESTKTVRALPARMLILGALVSGAGNK